MLTAGLRIAEAASVRGSDVWKEDGVVWLSIIGKGNKERNVLITHPVIGKMVLKRAELVGSDTLAKIQRRTLLSGGRRFAVARRRNYLVTTRLIPPAVMLRQRTPGSETRSKNWLLKKRRRFAWRSTDSF